ncbi:MAG: prepilin peptidase [Deltaproteobacteria bacterium]|nr:prepilin peptidase [Deltaproteobacteria bacterium]
MPIEILIPVAVFIFGAIVGSFLNVCIYRLPRKESLAFPGSHCPVCNTSIRFYDNVPIASWIFLLGKCRKCRSPISIQYPIVEAVNAGGYFYLYTRFGLTGEAAVYALFFSALLVITFIDLHHKIIPDVISLPGIGVGLLASLFVLPLTFWDALIGAALGWGLFYLVALLSRGGMGGGDIKLISMIGAFLGWEKMLLTIMSGAFAGSIVGIVLMILFKKSRKYAVPFGPFLALGALASLFWGTSMIQWYLHFM